MATKRPYRPPQTSSKPLLVGNWSFDNVFPMAVIFGPAILLSARSALTASSLAGALVSLVLLAAVLVPIFILIYPTKGMRPAVYLDGFRPAPIGWWPLEWVRRGFRAKVLWGEVEYIKVMRDPTTGMESQLRVFLPKRDAFMFGLRMPDSRGEAEVALLILERWIALGGKVDAEVWR